MHCRKTRHTRLRVRDLREIDIRLAHDGEELLVLGDGVLGARFLFVELGQAVVEDGTDQKTFFSARIKNNEAFVF